MPSGRVLLKLADVLQVSVDELLGRSSGSTSAVLRETHALYSAGGDRVGSTLSLAVPVVLADDDPHLDSARALMNEWMDCFLALEDACGAMKRAVIPLTFPFQPDEQGVELLAQQVRHFLGIGEGVIFDYLELFENSGLRIISLSLPGSVYSAAYYDALNANAFIFIQSGMSAERQIFELVKRLGSIYFFTRQGLRPLQSSAAGNALDEARAVRKFTAFFLMPGNAVRTSVAQLGIQPTEWTYDLVLRLKHRYGVSAQSFVYRLRELGLIEDTLAEDFRARIQQHYKRTGFAEPDDTRRILSPNGRIGDLYAISRNKKSAKEDLAKYQHLFEAGLREGGRP